MGTLIIYHYQLFFFSFGEHLVKVLQATPEGEGMEKIHTRYCSSTSHSLLLGWFEWTPTSDGPPIIASFFEDISRRLGDLQ